jgi:autotransporter-associated beta strand protein
LAVAVAALALAGPGRALAAAKPALSSASVTKLVTVEDDLNFLAQVSLMAAQVNASGAISSAQKKALLQGSASDVRTASSSLTLARQVANDPTTNRLVAVRLVGNITALANDTAAVRTAAAGNALSKASLKAFSKMGADAQTFGKEIQRDYKLLPASSQPVSLSLAPVSGQSRIFAGNTTVSFVLSGPKSALLSANGSWSFNSGRRNAAEPPLTTPFVTGNLSGSATSATESVHTTATSWGAWTYVYFALRPRVSTLLLLNLGGPAPGGSSSGNSTAGNSTAAGSLNTGSVASITVVGTSALTLTGNNTYSGVVAVNGGGSLVINGGSLVVSNNLNVMPIGSPLSNLTINTGGGSLTIGSLPPLDNGTLTFRDVVNVVTGSVILNLPALITGFDGQGLTVTTGSNATITFAGGIGPAIFATGTLGVTYNGTGNVVLAAASTYTGPTIINGGTVTFDADDDFGTNVSLVINGGTLQWAANTTSDISTYAVDLASSGPTFDLNGNNITFANPIGGGGSGNLTITGNGTLTLAANNTYTGSTTINSGTLIISDWSGLAAGYFVLGNGTLEYSPDANDSLTVSAIAPDGSAYPWGNTTYEVDEQADGSWAIPALGIDIANTTGGYAISAWSPPAD